jgi:hypothetical protein
MDLSQECRLVVVLCVIGLKDMDSTLLGNGTMLFNTFYKHSDSGSYSIWEKSRQHLERWIVCTLLSVNVFITLAKQ